MTYIESIILGISLAAVPGVIFFEVVRRTLTKGFWSGALLSVGEFLANFAILMLTFFGLYHFLFLKPMKLFFFLLGGAILVWIGMSSLKTNKEDIVKSYNKKISNSNSIALGFGLALNPMALVVWPSVGGAYLAQYTFGMDALINIILIAFGVLLFYFVLAYGVYYKRHKISIKYVLLLSKIFGVLLLGAGLYFFYQFVHLFLI
ncbi:MAG: LysE family transporter [Candidatus Aenigmarchaeota archaeon]|nr:LysE family transporter [Candidatus Aenigmarchaeota archaeon]